MHHLILLILIIGSLGVIDTVVRVANKPATIKNDSVRPIRFQPIVLVTRHPP